MGTLSRRQALAGAGVAAAAALGVAPARAGAPAGAAVPDIRIDHPGPNEEVANHFVAFGSTNGLVQLKARLASGGNLISRPRVRVVLNPTSKRLFWFIPVGGAMLPGRYKLDVRDPVGTSPVAASVEFTVRAAPAAAAGIAINYPAPPDDGKLATVGPDFVAYGTDGNMGFTQVTYILRAPNGLVLTDMARLDGSDWYAPILGVPAPTYDDLQVFDDVAPAGDAQPFWVSRDG
jgi:hypothetical protein